MTTDGNGQDKAPGFFARNALYFKIAMLGFLCLALLIPLQFVRSTVLERQARSHEVIAEIAGSWGGAQFLSGPVLTIPFEERTTLRTTSASGAVTEREQIVQREIVLLPETLEIAGQLSDQIRRKGIYEALLYSGDLSFSGSFAAPDLEQLGVAPSSVDWDRAQLILLVSDPRGIGKAPPLDWGGREAAFQPYNGAPDGSGIAAALDAASLQRGEIAFRMNLTLNGSRLLAFRPVGRNTEVALRSSWPHPGFGGGTLPAESSISEAGFSASWQVSHFAREMPQFWRSDMADSARLLMPNHDTYWLDSRGFLATELVSPVDFYLKAERSVKHGLLFIALIFGALFTFEAINGGRLHFLQYSLIGAALVVFYLLLLSLAEILGFAAAYAIAASLSLGLVASYTGKITGSRKQGATVAGLLA
ncbi:MAG: cell envelope integrity protein CreD, partial [Rhodovibrionaceae bacterium]